MSNLHLSGLVVDGGDPDFCQYLFNGNKEAPYAVITFGAAHGFTAASLEAGLRQEQTNVVAVPSLADSAFSFAGTAGGIGLSFLSGDIICSIFTTVPTTSAGEIALARLILGG
jgi:hypothetical protein